MRTSDFSAVCDAQCLSVSDSFCTGVPVSMIRFFVLSLLSAAMVLFELVDLSRCPSSQMSSGEGRADNADACLRNSSYDTISTAQSLPEPIKKSRTWLD